MNRIARYVADGTLHLFLLVWLGGSAVYAIIDVGEDVDRLARAGLAPLRAAECVAARLPAMALRIMPMAAAIAATLQFGLMARHGELVATRAAGVGDHRLLRPIACAGLLLAALHFALGEGIVPAANRHAAACWERDVLGRAPTPGASVVTPSFTCLARRASPSGTALEGATFLFVRDGSGGRRRLEAERATYEGGRWRLRPCRETIWEANGTRRVVEHAAWDLNLALWPDDFRLQGRDPAQLGLRDLAAAARRERQRGGGAPAWRVDWHGRVAAAAGTLIMAFAAAVVGLRRGRGDLIGTAAWGVFWTFTYWVLSGYCLALGYDGILPPAAAGWLPNAVVAGAAMLFGLRTATAAPPHALTPRGASAVSRRK